MSYQAVVTIIRNVAEAVNPNCFFEHGRKWDASLNFNEAPEQIYLYPLTAPSVDLTNTFYEAWQCVMGFYVEDEPDSTPLNMESKLAALDSVTTEFLNTINDVEGIEIRGIRKEPNYRQMAGTYTGWIISFTLGATTDVCSINVVYPNIPAPNLLFKYSELHTINEGDNTITHSIGERAKFVTFLDINNREVYFDWRNVDENSIVVNSTADSGQIRINIIAYED